MNAHFPQNELARAEAYTIGGSVVGGAKRGGGAKWGSGVGGP